MKPIKPGHSPFRHAEMMVYFKTNPEWVWYDDEEIPHLTEKAPPEAVESYNYWKKRYEEQTRTGICID